MFRKLGLETKKNESGLASIVVVGVLIVLLTVISLGFARIMDRAVKTAMNDQTSAAASYAAQSGVNDLATYIRNNPNVNATECNHLIGTAGAPGPFYTSSNLSGDKNSQYTCILLNQRPDVVAYQRIQTLKSKVVKLTTEATTGSVDRLLFSWQSSSDASVRKNRVPAPVSTLLPDVTSWNQSDYIPMARLTLYPVKTTGSVSTVQQDSRTIFLYPNPYGSGAPDNVSYSALTEGGLQPVECRQNDSDNDVTGFTDLASMDCNLAITGLANIPDISYYYLRVVPIYNNLDFEVKAKDIDDRTIRFEGVQAVLDVTAKVGPASKRLQARVDIGGNPANPAVDPLEPSPNVSPEDNSMPDFSLRSANAICKRTLFQDSPYAYVTFDGNPATCRGSTIDIPNAVITYFRINGVDDTTPNPAPYNGVSYIPANGTANLTWRTEDAISCEGSRGIGAWPGNKIPPIMTWAGSTGTGAQSISSISSVTDFDLRCRGPESTTSTRTVRAWPHPTASISGPGSFKAGESFTINFSSTNSSRCEMRSSGGKVWNQDYTGIQPSSGSSPADSKTFSTTWDDRSSYSYTVTCYDPSGRSSANAGSGPATWTVGDSGSNTTRNPPDCNGTVQVEDNGDGRVRFGWNGNCPTVDPGGGTYCLYSTTDPGYAPINSCGVGQAGGWQYTAVRYGVQFCLGLRSIAGSWGQLHDTGSSCSTPYYPQVIITSFEAHVWDQGPLQCDPSTGWGGYWYCRNNPNVLNFSNGCPSGIHRWTACGGHVSWSSNNATSCRHRSETYGYFGGSYGGNGSSGPWRWAGMGSPYRFWLECEGPSPGPGGGPNVATRCWNAGYCGGSP